ncbi:thrombospondin type 3 repeat-containing protein [Parasporobacterium paucivorans]|uniref:Uncharacterized protein n=1 Tax=Parasporobacterium paucivorans DSM 15970 TaxID=1122934 RepID=A0A1M6D1S7_9FIRM|nr:thrombospondin type 3 repeat-containing protein [Parasporobacterium paucivorans]SHI67217.1 hypothetical protein SAMN02745691_00647 [Parasporobacterium paucivorans DSM 15970]
MNKKINTGKTWKTTFTVAFILSLSAFALAGCSSGNSSSTAATLPAVTSGTNTKSSTDTDGDGMPDSVEKTYGTNPYTSDSDGDGVNDKQDKEPLKTENLMKETSTAPLEVTVTDAKVEDNATADHLEITMTNNGNTDLNNFDIYYTMTDKVDKTLESYYQVLNGLTLNAGETKTIHFDNKVSEAGHYYMNMNGLYGNSKNGLTFDIQLHAKDFQPMTFQIEKAKGTAEVAD